MGEPPPTRAGLHVAVIGSGLAGLSLALSLQHNHVSCTVYEASDTPERVISGSLQLAPNGQLALEPLGVLPRLHKHSRFYKVAPVHDNTGKVTSEILLGDEKEFGYDCMRIIRGVLVRELASAARERGIEIVCNKKFTGVLSESKTEGVRFRFEDGTTEKADLLVGADGIHSRVRREMFPDAAEPTYIGNVAVSSSCARNDIEGMQDGTYGTFIGEAGAILFGGHVPDDSDYLIGVQRAYPDQSRKEWEAFSQCKKRLRAFLEEGIETWPSYVQSAIKNARDDNFGLWVLRVLPEMKSWVSEQGRVVLVGDGAHAIPPSAGQGANMAFEDGNTLGLVLGSVIEQPGKNLDEGLEFWQKMRRERIELVLEMTMQWNKMRQSAAEREKMQKGEIFESATTHESRIEQMRWLFDGVNSQRKQIEDWIAGGKRVSFEQGA